MLKEIRTYADIPKHMKAEIHNQVDNLVVKFGHKAVRLVSMKLLQDLTDKRLLQEAIKNKKEELRRLESKSR